MGTNKRRTDQSNTKTCQGNHQVLRLPILQLDTWCRLESVDLDSLTPRLATYGLLGQLHFISAAFLSRCPEISNTLGSSLQLKRYFHGLIQWLTLLDTSLHDPLSYVLCIPANQHQGMCYQVLLPAPDGV